LQRCQRSIPNTKFIDAAFEAGVTVEQRTTEPGVKIVQISDIDGGGKCTDKFAVGIEPFLTGVGAVNCYDVNRSAGIDWCRATGSTLVT